MPFHPSNALESPACASLQSLLRVKRLPILLEWFSSAGARSTLAVADQDLNAPWIEYRFSVRGAAAQHSSTAMFLRRDLSDHYMLTILASQQRVD